MELNKIEQENLKAFLASVYGNQARSWEMNDEVFNQTIYMLQESNKCTDLMDFVPRAMPLGANPISYIKKTARNILLRKLKNSKNQYKVCVSTSAAKFKTKLVLAGLGF